jgi:hypothetical protein
MKKPQKQIYCICNLFNSVIRNLDYAGFEVLTEVTMKSFIYRSGCGLLYAGFFPGLLFHPEDARDMFFRNIG